MPSSARPITVILNANQAKRFVLLLEALPSGIDVTAPSPQHLSILSEARKKFRVKQLNKIYLKGGAEFSPSPVEPLDDDVREVWVSKGEPFVGKAGPAPGSKRAGARVDIIAEESYVDPEAVRQLKRVAELEGAQAAIGMPDLHPGNRFPIGCAVAVRGIYPALIGTDVGCGIALYRLASVPGRMVPANIADQLKGLDDPWDGDVRAWLAERGIDRESKFDVSSLGTVGAGNHFAEICIVESIKNEVKCEELGVKTGDMYLLVHTGSRGLGKSILEACSQSSANPFYPTGTNELAEYLAEHDYAVQWARANRDLVAHRLAACLGLDEGRSGMPSHPLKLVDVTHNSVTKHMLDVEREDAIHSEELWIHRKGAAPANMGVVPCPGSRGDFSWLLEPIGDGNDNGESSTHSLAHGAGRLHPRSAATLQNNVPGTTTSLGSEVVCTDPALMKEERPEAYKSIEAVVKDLESRGVAKGMAILRPVVTYKVRSPWAKK